MRLIDLNPLWIAREGNPHAILAFRCPRCQRMWLTCTLVALKGSEQCKLIAAAIPDNGGEVVTCKTLAWAAEGLPDFDRLSIRPSIDASASGHWHGHITNGEIK